LVAGAVVALAAWTARVASFAVELLAYVVVVVVVVYPIFV